MMAAILFFAAFCLIKLNVVLWR